MPLVINIGSFVIFPSPATQLTLVGVVQQLQLVMVEAVPPKLAVVLEYMMQLYMVHPLAPPPSAVPAGPVELPTIVQLYRVQLLAPAPPLY